MDAGVPSAVIRDFSRSAVDVVDLDAPELDTKPGQFEHRLEIYSPPYLFHGPRPQIAQAPDTVRAGEVMTVTTPDAARVATARLIRQSAVTHPTDLEQRSVALDIGRNQDGTLSLAVPESTGIVPRGYYMLFLVDGDGTPTAGHWLRVT